MIITNHHHLPQPLVHAVTHDRYEAGDGDISCTTLIAPAQIRILKEKNADAITQDAIDRIWSMIGSAVHYILENAVIDMKAKGEWDDATHIAEQRFYAEIGGKKLSAQIDLKEHNNLIDFKVTSVWSVKDAIYGKGKFEWDAQLNIQRWLMYKNGITDINNLYIMAICRDWNHGGSLRDKDYPPRGAMIEIPVWSYEKTEEYIMERLNAHYGAHTPLCTPTECWEKPSVYALMKEGRKSAIRLLDTPMDAMDYAITHNLGSVIKPGIPELGVTIELNTGITIEHRKGDRMRCDRYCEAAPFCDQYKDWKADE
jgi:hypothetical protein